MQTHINDIMMKRYSKAKAAQEGGADLAAGGPQLLVPRGGPPTPHSRLLCAGPFNP